MSTRQRRASPVAPLFARVAEPRERVPLDAGPRDPAPRFSAARPVRERCPTGDPRSTTRPRSGVPVAGILGLALFASAVVTHLICLRRAKRHLGF